MCINLWPCSNITVNPLQLVKDNLLRKHSGNTPNDGIICTGAAVVFTATSGFTNYNFKLNGITVQYGAGNTYTSDTLHNGDVISVEVTNSTNCVASFTNTITVNTLPDAGTISGSSSVCAGSTITLTDANQGAYGAVTIPLLQQ